VLRVRSGRLSGLACDVFPEEPWPHLRESGGRVAFTPHASGYTVDLGARVADEVASALLAWSRGEPVPWTVPPSATGRVP